MNNRPLKSSPGLRLRTAREGLGLSMRRVHAISVRLARKLRRKEFAVPATRVHEYERKGVVPSIHRVYTLAYVYRRKMKEVLSWYGVPIR